jgi:hypothetical protein
METNEDGNAGMPKRRGWFTAILKLKDIDFIVKRANIYEEEVGFFKFS